MPDYRNLCPKFLSNECPNNCHYDTWCKHREELIGMVSATRKVCIKCGQLFSSSENLCVDCRENDGMYRGASIKGFSLYPVVEDINLEPFIRCPECRSTNIGAVGIFTVTGSVKVNTGEIENVDFYDGDPNEDFDDFICCDCNHEWECS